MSSTSGGNDGDDSHWSLYRGGMNDNGWMNGNAEMGEDDEDITLDPDYEDAGSSFGSDNSGLATAGSREMPEVMPAPEDAQMETDGDTASDTVSDTSTEHGFPMDHSIGDPATPEPNNEPFAHMNEHVYGSPSTSIGSDDFKPSRIPFMGSAPYQDRIRSPSILAEDSRSRRDSMSSMNSADSMSSIDSVMSSSSTNSTASSGSMFNNMPGTPGAMSDTTDVNDTYQTYGMHNAQNANAPHETSGHVYGAGGFADNQMVDNTAGVDTVVNHLTSLQCEFAFISDCTEVFQLGQEKAWARHTMSHLRDKIPHRCKCWFCDKVFDAEEKKRPRKENFERRMHHIADHFRHNDQMSFHYDLDLAKHLCRNRVISKEKYTEIKTYEASNTMATDNYSYNTSGYSYSEASGSGQYLDGNEVAFDNSGVQETGHKRDSGKSGERRHGDKKSDRKDGKRSEKKDDKKKDRRW